MKDYLNIEEVADVLRISVSTVERLIRKGIMPAYYQIEVRSARLWNPKDIDKLIKKSRRVACQSCG